jgi:undecaprenyl-diphosphatase
MKDVGLVLLCAALCTLIAGGVDDTIVKPMIGRWRPTHDPEIGYLVDVVNGYRSGKYGFFSAHAANTFSICVFFCLLVRNRIFTSAVVSWSLLNCWTRLYLGVHFPSDIFVGLCWGALTGIGVYYFYRYLTRDTHLMNYRHVDIDVVIGVLVMTLVYAVLKALIH